MSTEDAKLLIDRSTRMSAVLSSMRTKYKDMTLLQAEALMRIAAAHPQGGIYQKDLEKLVGATDGGLSRVIAVLGKFGRRGAEGLGLVAAETDINDRRRQKLALTYDGEAVVEKMLRHL